MALEPLQKIEIREPVLGDPAAKQLIFTREWGPSNTSSNVERLTIPELYRTMEAITQYLACENVTLRGIDSWLDNIAASLIAYHDVPVEICDVARSIQSKARAIRREAERIDAECK